jgi:hypothetical protein
MRKIDKKELIGLSPNSKLLKEYKESLPNLSSIQYEALIGLMLGDVSIQSQNGGKTHRIKFEWSNKYKTYIDHVYSLYSDWILSYPHKKIRLSNVYPNNEIFNWGFQTISHKEFNKIADLFIKNKIKQVPTNLIKYHLTPVGLAYWFMDDGGKLDYNKNSKNRGLVLNTQSFTKNEVEQMIIELNNKFNLSTFMRMNKQKHIIVIPSSDFNKFYNLTFNYINPISCMRYKLFINEVH